MDFYSVIFLSYIFWFFISRVITIYFLLKNSETEELIPAILTPIGGEMVMAFMIVSVTFLFIVEFGNARAYKLSRAIKKRFRLGAKK